MFTRGFYRTFCISFHESLWYSRDHTLFIWHYIHLNKTKCMRQKKFAGIYDKVNYESVKGKWWILVKLLILSLCTGLDWDIIFFFFFSQQQLWRCVWYLCRNIVDNTGMLQQLWSSTCTESTPFLCLIPSHQI